MLTTAVEHLEPLGARVQAGLLVNLEPQLRESPDPRICRTGSLPFVAGAVEELMETCNSIKIRIQKSGGVDSRFRVVGALSGPAMCTGSAEQKHSTTAEQEAATTLVGGMLNFGHSGGANVPGSAILPERWLDIGNIMDSLQCEFFFAIGCRCPLGTDLARIIPSFPFDIDGHRSSEYGTVAFLRRRASMLADSVHWMPQAIDTMRTCWVEVGCVSAGVGVYVLQ